MKKIFVILMVLLCSLNVFSAVQEIEIFETGDAYIEGTAEGDFLEEVPLVDGIVKGYTWELISKKGADWKFSYRIPLESEYDIYIQFPEGSELHAIDVSGKSSITSIGGSPIIHLTGNDSLSAEISYHLTTHEDTTYYWVIPVVILVAIFLFLRFLPKKRKSKLNIEKFNAVKLTLNENQLQIVEALLQKKGEASQTVIQHLSGLPKSSLSRNIELLDQKEVVVKYSNGNYNYIKLHPRFYD